MKVGAFGSSEEGGALGAEADDMGEGGAGPDEGGREVLGPGFKVEDKDPEDVDEKVQFDPEEENTDCPVPSGATILSLFGISSLGLLCVGGNVEVEP